MYAFCWWSCSSARQSLALPTARRPSGALLFSERIVKLYLSALGLVTSCSCASVAPWKNLRWYAPEKPLNTGTPGTARCHQPALRLAQEGNGRLRKQWRSCLRQKPLEGTVATGRVGLGYFPKTLVSQAHGKERHHLLQEEVQAGVKEERVSRAMGLRQQGEEYTATQDHLGKHLAGKFPSGPFPGTSCLWCPAMPSKPPCLEEVWDTFLPSLLWKRLFRTSQQLPKGSGWWSLSLASWPGA